MTEKTRKKLHRQYRKEFVEHPDNISFRQFAKEKGMSVSGLGLWQKNDVKNGKPSWYDLRDEYWQKKEEEAETKALAKDTKKDLAKLADRDLARADALDLLTTLRKKLSEPEFIEKLTDQAKIRDVIDILKEISKQIEGLGFADKVIVIGAPQPKEDTIETEFEILED